MNKEAFLAALRNALTGLPQDDVEERLAFYGEMIDDRMEEGMTEEEAVAGLDPVDEIAAQTVADIPLTRLVRETMNPGRRLRAWEIVLLVLGSPIWLSLLIALAAFVVWNINTGSVYVSVRQIIGILFRGEMEGESAYNIIWKIRFPRAVAAMFLGGGLALSGYLLQNFFHNPIAGPFVLGISSGAKLCVALMMIAAAKYVFTLHSVALITAAFVGAMLAAVCIYILAWKNGIRPVRIILAGVAVSFLTVFLVAIITPHKVWD